MRHEFFTLSDLPTEFCCTTVSKSPNVILKRLSFLYGVQSFPLDIFYQRYFICLLIRQIFYHAKDLRGPQTPARRKAPISSNNFKVFSFRADNNRLQKPTLSY